MQPGVMVIGLDGATYDVLLPLMEEGWLPHLADLYGKGVHGTLASTIPPVTGPAWTTLATGCNPGTTGVFDFWNLRADGGYRAISSQDFVGRSVWDYLSVAGHRVGVFNYPMLFPPYEVNGFMVSGLGSSEHDQITYPAELGQELHVMTGGHRITVPYHEAAYRDNEKRFFDEVMDLLDKNERAIQNLLATWSLDFFLSVVSASDFAQHYFWRHLDAGHPFHDPARADVNRRRFAEVWHRIDALVGAVCDGLDRDASILVVSDHGFGAETGTFNVNRWLREKGYLVLKRRGALEGILPLLRGLARGVLGRLMPAVFYRWRRRREAALLDLLFMDQIDWGRTRAYAMGNSTAMGSVYINRDLVSSTEYEQTRSDIISGLRALEDEWPGCESVDAYRREEVYSGERTGLAPDVIFSINNHACGVSRDLYAPDVFGSSSAAGSRTGSHRMEGILMAYGPHFRTGEVTGAAIADVAPTLLYLYGLPVPSTMEGKVLADLFEPSYIESHPVRMGPGLAPLPEGQYSREDELAVVERLRGLGYLD